MATLEREREAEGERDRVARAWLVVRRALQRHLNPAVVRQGPDQGLLPGEQHSQVRIGGLSHKEARASPAQPWTAKRLTSARRWLHKLSAPSCAGEAPPPQARRIVLMAFGENKAGIVKEAVEGPVSDRVAASYLQQHPGALVMLDYAAAAGVSTFLW